MTYAINFHSLFIKPFFLMKKFHVYADIVEDRIIGPFFFDQPLTRSRYHVFLQNELIPAPIDISPIKSVHNLPNEDI